VSVVSRGVPWKTGMAILAGCCLAAVISGASSMATAKAAVTRTPPPVDHQLCYAAAGLFKVPTRGVHLFDQFNPNGFVPTINPHATTLCNPVMKTLPNKHVFKITRPRAHLVCFPMSAENAQRAPRVVVANQFGTATVQPGKPNRLCVPSWKSLTGPPHMKANTPPGLNHFTCYPVRLAGGAYKAPAGILLRDEFSSKNVRVAVNPVPRQLCLPATKTITTKAGTKSYPMINPDMHLLCYSVSKTPIRNPVYAQNQFGSATMKVGNTRLLCLPSTKRLLPSDCAGSSSLTPLVTGTDVTAYVPKGTWSFPNTGVSVVNVEGTSITPTNIATPTVVNSCASNSTTGKTVCTGNDASVYEFTGTTLTTTVTSGGSGTISFSGGICTNCGVGMDSLHNRALIGLSNGGVPSFQFLNLATNTFGSVFASPAGVISEDPLVDPSRNLLLSAGENGNFELANIANPAAPVFYEKATGNGENDATGEDCSTGIALAPAELSDPSRLFIADLTQATLTPGSPGSWSAPSQNQTLADSSLFAGPTGIAVAQGTHTGVVTGEWGGNALTALALPTTSGFGIPAIPDWVTCSIGPTPDTFPWGQGADPHAVSAYQSPSSGHAIALFSNKPTNWLARVDLTKLLDPAVVPRTSGGHACSAGTLPASVLSFIPVP
jgi:hypothetical protein